MTPELSLEFEDFVLIKFHLNRKLPKGKRSKKIFLFPLERRRLKLEKMRINRGRGAGENLDSKIGQELFQEKGSQQSRRELGTLIFLPGLRKDLLSHSLANRDVNFHNEPSQTLLFLKLLRDW